MLNNVVRADVSANKSQMSTAKTPNIDKLITEIKAFNILDDLWFKEKTRFQLEKKLKALKKDETDRIKRVEEDRRASKKNPYDWYLVCDVEATCQENSGFAWENEIIEFPVVLINGQTMEIVDEFHRYCRPGLHPTLSSFCSSLTGINQEIVDAANPFCIVWKEFREWLEQYDKPPFKECLFCTDGPWDLRDFVEKEFVYYGFNRPDFMWQILDIRKLFKSQLETSGNISDMLKEIGLEFEGREHCGLDDSRNIARIVLHLASKNVRLEPNCNLKKNKAKPGKWKQLRKTAA